MQRRRAPGGYFVPANYGGPVQIGEKYYARGGAGKEIDRETFLANSYRYLRDNKDFRYLAPRWFAKASKEHKPKKSKAPAPPKKPRRVKSAVGGIGRRRDNKRLGGAKHKVADYRLETGRRNGRYSIYATFRVLNKIMYDGTEIPQDTLMTRFVGQYRLRDFLRDDVLQDQIEDEIHEKGNGNWEFMGFMRSPHEIGTGYVNR